VTFAIAAWPHNDTIAQRSRGAGEAIALNLRGAIGPATADYLLQGFAAAAERKAAVVILRIDTPGGLDTAMRDIIRGILASSVPVIAYVSPSGARAASAGTYILYASHLAAMAPGTNLGAATPVALGGGLFGGGQERDGKPDDAKKAPTDAHSRKSVNDAVAYIRGLADLRGRNADWAEQAVREAASLPASEALAKGVIDLVAGSQQELLAKADGRTVTIGEEQRTLNTAGLAVVALEPDWRSQLLAVLTNPNIAYLLLLAGLYGLLFEFINPGAVAPGVIGGIALLLGLYSLNLLPVNYAGAALVLLGVALMVAEAFLPSFGIVGIGGIVAFAIGSLLMFDAGVPGFAVAWPVVVAATIASAAFLLLGLGVGWRAHRRAVVTGEPALIGRIGRVVHWNGNSGQVHVHGENWSAESDASVSPGDSVRIVARKDLTLVIEPATHPPSQR
jgi:membrane-bound serine protease (ClpP class)